MLRINSLKTEYKTAPLGMDEPSPRFSWLLEGESHWQRERRIIVRNENGQIVWDSGFVADSSTIQIPYQGEALKPHTRYYWRVEVRDENGVESTSDDTAFFETGFLGTPWQAKWITRQVGNDNLRAPQRFVHDFFVTQPIVKARLHITSLGLYEAYLNGQPVTDQCFTPGWTDYFHRVQYQTYDVTGQIQEGRNAFAAYVAEGWFNGKIARYWAERKLHYGDHALLKAELRITLADGTVQIIATDKNWYAWLGEGAIRMSDIYMGETYDAQRDDHAWKLSVEKRPQGCPFVHEEEPEVDTVWQSGAPVRRMMRRYPAALTRRPSGVWIVDFGQNLVGRERFTVRNGVAGAMIVIRHGEMLNPDGSLYTENLRSALATTTYICSGSGQEEYEPTFTFYGFRYLEISGWPGELTEEAIHAEVIYSELRQTGKFSCSEPLLNQLYSNIVWGQRSNFLDIPTDCPQRDERLGWSGDTQVFMNMATYNMEAPEFYRKWIDDLNLGLTEKEGCFAFYAPDPYKMTPPATGWSDAGIICPWLMYLKYGDIRLLKNHYANMAHWLDWQVENAGGALIVKNTCLGDWLNINADTPEAYLSTAYLAGMSKLLAKIAGIIGRNEEACFRKKRATEIAKAFGREFFTSDGELKVRTQTAALLALHFDITPEQAREKTIAFLVHDIRVERKLHLSTGFLGTPLLLKTLTEVGEVDLAYELLMQPNYPGWLYPVTQGATTMWERWDSYSHEKGFGDVAMNSFNHYAYGAVGDWFFETICGINPEELSPGFHEFRLAPRFGRQLVHASAEYSSACGTIRSSWRRSGELIEWKISVPCNTRAHLVIHEPFRLKENTKLKEMTQCCLPPGEHTVIVYSKLQNAFPAEYSSVINF